MVTYRFKVSFEDFEDVSRDIEIRSAQTFDDLHYAIHASIGFDASKPASFFLSDDNWKKGSPIATNNQEENDENQTLLKNARVCDFISDPHQKIYYVFDPDTPWNFHIELVKINKEEDHGASYPRCIKEVGEAPKQYQSTNIAALPIPEDFDPLTDDLEEDTESEEGEELDIGEGELPEGEEKDEFLASDIDGGSDDLETADEDSIDEIEDSDEKDY
jgi:hypothetical protein